MSPREFLTTVTATVTLMALLALVELAVPLFSRPPGRRRHGTVNLRLTAVNFLVNWALMTGAASLALAFSLRSSGLMTRLGIPFAAQLVVGVAVLDFGYGYLAHRAMHWSPTLWRLHRVHHSDPFVDVTTTYRSHPIESLWRFLFVIVPVGVLGVPAAAVLLHRLLSAINAILEHANIRLWAPLERLLSLMWVTPHMHKLHHSRARRETDSNYGNLLSVYDRVLGTFTPSTRVPAVVYGLDDADADRTPSLAALLRMPCAVTSDAPTTTAHSTVEQGA